MDDPARNDADASGRDFDYSTPEAQEALRNVSDLILEIRQEVKDNAVERRVALYERTLGLAVIPVLLRRAVIVLRRKISGSDSAEQ